MVIKEERFGYKIFVRENRMEIRVCYDDQVYNSSNWTPDPIVTTVPMLYSQLIVQLSLSGIVFLLLMPLKQSRLVSQIIAGILIGPTLLGSIPTFVAKLSPFISDTVLEYTMSLGTVFYMFQLGLEMNLVPISKIDRKTTALTIAGMVLPLAVGFSSFFLIIPPLNPDESILPKLKSAYVWAIALAGTNLPDLTRTLADLKIMRTDIARTAIASSFISDIATWLHLVTLISISQPGQTVRMCISTVSLILFFTFLARPTLSWLIAVTTSDDHYKEYHVQFVFCGVLISAFLTDSVGLGSFVGAFMFGFSFPSGQLARMTSQHIEKVSSWIMVPLYCTVSGIKSPVTMMVPHGRSIKHVVLFMVISWAAKIASAFLVSFGSNKKTLKEVFTLGVLMNSKGLVSLIVINIGRELYLSDVEASTIMVTTILLLMMSVLPIIKYTYKNQKRMMNHKTRSIQSIGADSTFRILTCLHSRQQVEGIANLLRLSNPTSQSRIHAIGVHLVELTEHTSAAMLIVHDAFRSKSREHHKTNESGNAGQVVEALEEFGRENGPLISLECMTAISRYSTMHVDICSIAEDKRAALIIIPFHKQENGKDDEAESMDSYSIRSMNQQVLWNAPCTIGVLVDHGLGNHMSSSTGAYRIIMFYIGGPDDREALAYVWRMAWLPNVHLTVVRFVQGSCPVEATPAETDAEGRGGILNLLEENEMQMEMDAELIHEFKSKMANNGQSVSLSEVVVNSGEETLVVIRDVMQQNDYELCVIGKGNRRISAAESGLLELAEFQELGAIGDAIVTTNFSTGTSVLIIQKYDAIAHRKGEELVE
ncbi:hypothetical protein SAY87_031330 [Trapa incisa]|uniref:Cation/H+ exchanger domain-containing protein n=1 Tax=Trapa incisa TaxID=236973 RepID=A0AAN7KUT4_9MYRT|nr:hypothetical protein SAY87_031330 [Trapa incisa]